MSSEPDALASGLPRVSVAMPVHRISDASGLRRAFACIAGQTVTDIEILLVANGSDGETIAEVRRLCADEPRSRLIELPEANLAAALNVALREASCPLVARMDADDACHPDRLRIQREYMLGHPRLAAAGSAWERVGDAGERTRVDVPTDPAEIRWRLLLGNPLAHGSMMLRRDMVLDVGGYDETCRRAQDYDLWLRLSQRFDIGAVPEVLYEYHARHTGGREESHSDQSLTAARALVRAWSQLGHGDAASVEGIASAIAPMVGGSSTAGDAARDLEAQLRMGGPTAPALIARMWVEWSRRAGGGEVAEVCRRARVREVCREMKEKGASGVWLWGAGRHTAWLLGREGEHGVDGGSDLGMPVRGIVDDAASGQVRCGFTVQSPSVLRAGEWVLISSDGFEEQIWRASGEARARGVHIRRLYGDNSACP